MKVDKEREREREREREKEKRKKKCEWERRVQVHSEMKTRVRTVEKVGELTHGVQPRIRRKDSKRGQRDSCDVRGERERERERERGRGEGERE